MHTDIQLVSTLNKKYLPGARAFLRSLTKHNKINYLYNFFIFDEISNSDKESLEFIYPHINFIEINKQDYSYYNTNDVFRNWGFNCFNRFEIFTLNCKKLIFFDLDMIVLGSLDELFTSDVRFGSVEIESFGRLDHPTKRMFDGGLMIISEEFLTNKTKDRLIEISKFKKWSSDEPVLNLYFEDSVTFLPKKYNILSYEYGKHKNNCSILQYVGSKKPWFGDTIQDIFDEYIIKKCKVTEHAKMQRVFNSYAN